MKDLKVAAVCMRSAPGEAERNLDRMQAFVWEAADNGADLVCFPELSVTGYTLKDRDDLYGGLSWNHAVKRLARMARQTNLVIIAGLAEPSKGPDPFITQLIVGPNGLMGLHRKTHLSPHEKEIYWAGQKIDVIPWGKARLGIQLCYEAHFPEISTLMSLKGAEILLIPHASPRGNPGEKLKSWLRHLPARAFDNGVFVVACNQVGDTKEGFSFPGVALVLGPDGLILAKYAGREENILYSDLSTLLLHDVRQSRMKYFFPLRRPELYKDISGA